MIKLDIRLDLDLSTTEVNGKRHYRTPYGVFPSVTTVLDRYPKTGLDEWRKAVGEIEAARVMKRAANFGTLLHDSLEQYVMKGIEPKNHPFLVPRFKQVKKVLDERVTNIFACETALYSKHLEVAGRTDLIGLFDGVSSVIDFKTSIKPKEEDMIEHYFCQEAAYAAMFYELTQDRDIAPRQLVTIISPESGTDADVYIQPVGKWLKKFKELL